MAEDLATHPAIYCSKGTLLSLINKDKLQSLILKILLLAPSLQYGETTFACVRHQFLSKSSHYTADYLRQISYLWQERNLIDISSHHITAIDLYLNFLLSTGLQISAGDLLLCTADYSSWGLLCSEVSSMVLIPVIFYCDFESINDLFLISLLSRNHFW